MERISLNNILKVKELKSELELERASSLRNKLLRKDKEDLNTTRIRNHLKELILKYEKDHWSDFEKISDEQIKESDRAEEIVKAENEFYYKRKILIKKNLKATGLKQNDLAKILGHRKSYMSELINGLRPFSKEDIIILNRLFKIKLEDLIPTFIKQDRVVQISETLKALNNDKLKLSSKDLDLQLA